MKKLILYYFLIFATPTIALAQMTTDEASAITSINQYFDALKIGDTQQIKTLLSGNMLNNTSSLLNNPDYQAYLQKKYAGAQLEIVSAKTLSNKTILVNTKIQLNVNEILHLKFQLKKDHVDTQKYVIYSESE